MSVIWEAVPLSKYNINNNNYMIAFLQQNFTIFSKM